MWQRSENLKWKRPALLYKATHVYTMQYTGATHERTIRHHVTLYMGPTPPWVALLFPRNHKAISFCSNLTRTSTGVSGYCCAPKGWLLKFNLEAMLCLVALIRQQQLWHLTLQTCAASSNFISFSLLRPLHPPTKCTAFHSDILCRWIIANSIFYSHLSAPLLNLIAFTWECFWSNIILKLVLEVQITS